MHSLEERLDSLPKWLQLVLVLLICVAPFTCAVLLGVFISSDQYLAAVTAGIATVVTAGLLFAKIHHAGRWAGLGTIAVVGETNLDYSSKPLSSTRLYAKKIIYKVEDVFPFRGGFLAILQDLRFKVEEVRGSVRVVWSKEEIPDRNRIQFVYQRCRGKGFLQPVAA